MSKNMDKFPSIDDVHEVLSDLTKLFDDRNDLLKSMFKDDKYKDFLLAENMQQLAEADKRDDSANGRIKKDLANGYEVLKAQTTMKKFANFISPGALPPMDLTSSDDYSEDDDYVEEEAPVEKEAPEKGDKGDKGDDGADAEIVQPKPDKPKPKSRVFSWQKQQTPKLKLQEGGAVAPSPMMNSLTPTAGQRPETKSGVKSLESLGLVGKKNVASELTEDLGLEDYKKALADAMALPLKAVAAGLAGLLDNMDVPGGEGAAIEGQVSKVGKTFGVKTKKKQKKDKEDKQNPLLSIARLLLPFGLGAKRKKPKQESYQIATEKKQSFDMYGNIIDSSSSYSDSRDEPKGGPSLVRSAPGYLGIGGAEHPKLAPDTLSTQGNTKIDAMRNSITNITQGAKNMFMKSKAVTQVKAATGLVSRLLGKVQPATEGSQYNNQDINNLTNQVMMDNEMHMSQLTNMQIKSASEQTDMGMEAIMQTIAKMGGTPMGIGESDPLPPAPLKPSKHLLHSISIVDGGQTPNDIV